MRFAVIGAGLYGRYVADLLKRYGHEAVIYALDESLVHDMSRLNCASLVNQARVHNGYHYPRSISTAKQSSKNYHRFSNEFKEALIDFRQNYGVPKKGSVTSDEQFEKFCKRAGLYLEPSRLNFVNYDTVSSTYDVEESAIDTYKMMQIAADRYLNDGVFIVNRVEFDRTDDHWLVNGDQYDTIINCSYAGLTSIESKAGMSRSPVRYEICEIVLFKDHFNRLQRTGLTLMDGQFVSFMPWGQDGTWSLTSVCHTPHESRSNLSNYLDVRKTVSKADLMIHQLKKYVDPSIVDSLEFVGSKFVVKTISTDAESDDNRLVKVYQKSNNFVSILGGKLDAIYELEDMLKQKGII